MLERLEVLDDGIGFVKLESANASDEMVVRAARVSVGKGVLDENRDRKLIAYMLREGHGSPFEHNSFIFHIKCPLMTRSQWHRHRIGVSYNEVSARYTEMKEEFYIPKRWRLQDAKNRQGSNEVDWSDSYNDFWRGFLREKCEDAIRAYRSMLDVGIGRELARMVLPQNLYTEFYFTANARSLMHFIGLRSHHHAQFEIRQYSDAMFRIWAERMPWTAAAFVQALDQSKYPGIARWVGERILAGEQMFNGPAEVG